MTTDSKTRKRQPLFDGCFNYFPDALLAVAEHSRKANEKHNPGEPLHWSKHKSNDHANCCGRHLLDMGPNWDKIDPEFGSLHATANAWRALALLQTVIEASRAGLTPREYLKRLEAEVAGCWIEWKGGANPAGDKRVDAKLRDGAVVNYTKADLFRWWHGGNRGDIVAYKVVG